jgi:hypothetical protein
MSEESRNAGTQLREPQITESIIGAAIAVHRELWPGFLESIYEQALTVEFAIRGIAFVRQKPIPLFYRDHQIGERRLDFKAAGLADGLILNYSSMPLTVKRVRRERGFEKIDL